MGGKLRWSRPCKACGQPTRRVCWDCGVPICPQHRKAVVRGGATTLLCLAHYDVYRDSPDIYGPMDDTVDTL